MTSREQLIKARLAILAMAAQLKNVAKACKLAGMSRSQFYVLKKAYQTSGKEGLAPRVRRKPEMPNRTPLPLENQILLKTHANPTVSYVGLAGNMKSEGISVTPAMVRYVWQRHRLSTRSARVQWVKRRNGHAGSIRVKDGPNTFHEVRPEARVPAPATPSPISIPGVF